MTTLFRLIFFGFFLNVSLVFSQNWKTIPDAFVGQCQQSFLDDIYKGVISLNSLSSRSQEYWVVYSDRENNRLKNSANGSNNGSKLKYMEPLYVKAVKDNWLHVYGFEDEEEKGWIQARFLVLSSWSLRTEGTVSIPRKAIILTSLDEMVSGGVNVDEVLAQKHYYNQPILLENAKLSTPKSFEILFVIKDQDGSVLLAANDNLNLGPLQNKSMVYGWIPKAAITLWNSRVVLTPNRTEEARSEYGDRGFPLYRNLERLKFCLENAYCDSSAIYYFTVGSSNLTAAFPVIGNINKNIKHVVCVASRGMEDRDPPSEGLILYIQETLNLTRNDAIEFLTRQYIASSAYAAIDYDGNGINELEQAVLFTQPELSKLKHSLMTLLSSNECLTHNERKYCLKNSLTDLCKSILGLSGISSVAIENLTFDQLWNGIAGVDFGTKKINQMKIKDITNLSNRDFRAFYNEFSNQAELFCNTSYDNCAVIFNDEGDRLYLIPLRDLPGVIN